jgi:hypothetical protein
MTFGNSGLRELGRLKRFLGTMNHDVFSRKVNLPGGSYSTAAGLPIFKTQIGTVFAGPIKRELRKLTGTKAASRYQSGLGS